MKAEEMMELMNRDEALIEELRPFLVPSKLGGDVIHHPLLIEQFLIPGKFALINKRFLYLKEAVDKARAEGKWSTFVFLHQRPYRLRALLEAERYGLTGADYWHLVREVWMDSENIHQNLVAWRRIWRHDSIGRDAVMNSDDIGRFLALPEEVEVYRGTGYKKAIRGLSWTTDLSKANWFARRFKKKGKPVYLVRGKVKRADIKAVFWGRGESEIVAEKVKVEAVSYATKA